MSGWAIGAALWTLVGCAPTVQLEVPAQPVVELSTEESFAVVARDRACQSVADQLVRDLGEVGLRVSPQSPVRLEVFACGDDMQWTFEQRDDGDTTQGRAAVEARSHAVLAVTQGHRVLAHLVGTGRHHYATGWQNRPRVVKMRNAARRHVTDDLAEDLLQQLAPVPTLVQRRVYPNAGPGTARDLHNLAVEAESAGDIDKAWLLALAAHQERPSPRSAAYLDDLARRRSALAWPR